MPTRYEKLVSLYARAYERDTKQHEAAEALAQGVLKELISSLEIPETLTSGPATGKIALQLCRVPANDSEPLGKLGPTTTRDAIETEDGENYRFGIVFRIFAPGIPVHAIVFRVHMRHKLNDVFEASPWRGADVGTFSASGHHHQPLSDFTDQIYNAVQSYFTDSLSGRVKPIGFELAPS